jgi:NAD(P) transhydrogenase
VYDVLVIGAGPAGWSAALQAAKLGLSVGLIEKSLMLGGACVHTGTLPSKSLRHVILELMTLRRAAHLGFHSTLMRPLRISDLMNPTAAVIDAHERTIRGFLERNRVEVLPGSGSFVAPGEVRVATRLGESTLRARHVVIASGSRPRRPAIIPFDDRAICDSDSILQLDAIPRSLAILGGGVIGCEYACMFAELGVKVTLIDRRERPLRFLDGDVLDALFASMRRKGIRLLFSEATQSVRVESGDRGPRTVVELASGRSVRADRLLVAAGRAPDTAALDLERVGIELDAEGQIKVDAQFRTTAPGVYAVGDVVGFPALASTSMHQGRMAVLHAAGRELPPPADLPLAIYTIPEISAVGRTEEECRARQIPYEVGVARYAETPRGQILHDVEGMLKLIFRRDDHRLIGIHLIGEDSAELVHAGLMGLYAGATIDQLASAVFNYPTLSEAYRVAALDGLNRLVS